MTLRVGFAQIDITPPLGIGKVGWLMKLTIEQVRDPLHARAAVWECAGRQLGFIQLDTLSVRWSTAEAIRRRISRELGFPGENVLVSATHNHAGPAVTSAGLVRRDEAYLETVVDRCVDVFRQALGNLTKARVGFAHRPVFGLSFNRRVVWRDGTTKCHGFCGDPMALHIEGPMDPELAVLAARDEQGRLLGALVNFTCHPTHLGAGSVCSAGWPGVLASEMARRGCPVTLLLNGAAGDVAHHDPARQGMEMNMEAMGTILAEHASAAITAMTYRDELALASRSVTLQLPYRNPTEDEIRGTVRGAQRFVDPKIYDQLMPELLQRIRQRKAQPAQVQAQFLDELVYVAMPAEYFCLLGLGIKEATHPRHTMVVGFANGMIGYVPTRQAFQRGGYETTFTLSSRMAPEVGDLLAEAAIDLIRAGP